jgi:hypothetical protein
MPNIWINWPKVCTRSIEPTSADPGGTLGGERTAVIMSSVLTVGALIVRIVTPSDAERLLRDRPRKVASTWEAPSPMEPMEADGMTMVALTDTLAAVIVSMTSRARGKRARRLARKLAASKVLTSPSATNSTRTTDRYADPGEAGGG